MAFKIIMAQPAVTRFFWEVEVLLTNLREVAPNIPVVVIFNKENPDQFERIKKKYDVDFYTYDLEEYDGSYPPGVQFYLIHKYLLEDPSRELDTYMQVDSDIIFRKFPKIPVIKGKRAIGSDCSGYIDYQYLKTRKNGEKIVDGFANILNIDRKVIEGLPGIGAQYIINQPTAQLYWHMWKDSYLLYHFLEPVDSDIQKWTAGMWSELYNLAKFGWEVSISPELDFCRPTDDIKMWDMVKILHNAGVVGESSASLFFKGKYVNETPFTEDLSWVRRDKAGKMYAKAIEKVYDSNNNV